MLQDLFDKASQFFERYDKMRRINRFDIPEVGINESEFAAWLTRCLEYLVQNGASSSTLRRWKEVSSIDSYDCSYKKPNFHVLDSYERRLRACVDFLMVFAENILPSSFDDPIEEGSSLGEHHNIKLLMQRMESALVSKDFPGVLHAAASIIETMAKDIVDLPSVQNQTLKSFFDRYRKDSALSNEILDYILSIYESRNSTPLAGHGSTRTPEISKEQALTICEITKAVVRIEYKLRR